MSKEISMIVGLLFLFAMGIGVGYWYFAPVAPKKEWTESKPIPAVAKVPKKKIPIKIKVLDKKEASEKLKLPEAIAKDDTKQIIGTGVATSYAGDTWVTAIVDTTPGETEGDVKMEVQQQPLPLFAFESKWKAGLRYGLYAKNNTDKFQTGLAADVYAGLELVQIKRCHIGPYVEITTNGDGKAMAAMECR